MNLHNLEFESVYAKGEDGEFHLVARRDECETKATAEKEYISREALLSAAKGYDWVTGLKTILKRIPAADVRPVVRGKWIQKKNWTRGVCSACSWEIAFVTGNSYNFCPNCGADMREEPPKEK